MRTGSCRRMSAAMSRLLVDCSDAHRAWRDAAVGRRCPKRSEAGCRGGPCACCSSTSTSTSAEAGRHDGAALGGPPDDLDDGEAADSRLAPTSNAANRYGVTPLSLACETGNAAIVERLLEAGADANAVARRRYGADDGGAHGQRRRQCRRCWPRAPT